MDKTIIKTPNRVRSIISYLQNQLDAIYSSLQQKENKKKGRVSVIIPIINWKYKKEDVNDFSFTGED